MSKGWDELRAAPPGELKNATLELHEAVQAIASAGQAFASRSDDDSHRGMRWWGELDAFLGEPLGAEGTIRVGVRPADLGLLVADVGGTVQDAFPLVNRTRAEGLRWLERVLSDRLDTSGLTLTLPEFTIPEGPAARGEPFSTAGTRERRALSSLYAVAATELEAVAAARAGASEVRCWPHHFDIATLITVRPGDGSQHARTIGVGMAPMGGGYHSWYWYVNAWPAPDPARLGSLREGRWHTQGWTGAVLTGEELLAHGRPEGMLRRFLDSAFEAASRAVSD